MLQFYQLEGVWKHQSEDKRSNLIIPLSPFDSLIEWVRTFSFTGKPPNFASSLSFHLPNPLTSLDPPCLPPTTLNLRNHRLGFPDKSSFPCNVVSLSIIHPPTPPSLPLPVISALSSSSNSIELELQLHINPPSHNSQDYHSIDAPPASNAPRHVRYFRQHANKDQIYQELPSFPISPPSFMATSTPFNQTVFKRDLIEVFQSTNYDTIDELEFSLSTLFAPYISHLSEPPPPYSLVSAAILHEYTNFNIGLAVVEAFLQYKQPSLLPALKLLYHTLKVPFVYHEFLYTLNTPAVRCNTAQIPLCLDWEINDRIESLQYLHTISQDPSINLFLDQERCFQAYDAKHQQIRDANNRDNTNNLEMPHHHDEEYSPGNHHLQTPISFTPTKIPIQLCELDVHNYSSIDKWMLQPHSVSTLPRIHILKFLSPELVLSPFERPGQPINTTTTTSTTTMTAALPISSPTTPTTAIIPISTLILKDILSNPSQLFTDRIDCLLHLITHHHASQYISRDVFAALINNHNIRESKLKIFRLLFNIYPKVVPANTLLLYLSNPHSNRPYEYMENQRFEFMEWWFNQPMLSQSEPSYSSALSLTTLHFSSLEAHIASLQRTLQLYSPLLSRFTHPSIPIQFIHFWIHNVIFPRITTMFSLLRELSEAPNQPEYPFLLPFSPSPPSQPPQPTINPFIPALSLKLPTTQSEQDTTLSLPAVPSTTLSPSLSNYSTFSQSDQFTDSQNDSRSTSPPEHDHDHDDGNDDGQVATNDASKKPHSTNRLPALTAVPQFDNHLSTRANLPQANRPDSIHPHTPLSFPATDSPRTNPTNSVLLLTSSLLLSPPPPPSHSNFSQQSHQSSTFTPTLAPTTPNQSIPRVPSTNGFITVSQQNHPHHNQTQTHAHSRPNQFQFNTSTTTNGNHGVNNNPTTSQTTNQTTLITTNVANNSSTNTNYTLPVFPTPFQTPSSRNHQYQGQSHHLGSIDNNHNNNDTNHNHNNTSQPHQTHHRALTQMSPPRPLSSTKSTSTSNLPSSSLTSHRVPHSNSTNNLQDLVNKFKNSQQEQQRQQQQPQLTQHISSSFPLVDSPTNINHHTNDNFIVNTTTTTTNNDTTNNDNNVPHSPTLHSLTTPSTPLLTARFNSTLGAVSTPISPIRHQQDQPQTTISNFPLPLNPPQPSSLLPQQTIQPVDSYIPLVPWLKRFIASFDATFTFFCTRNPALRSESTDRFYRSHPLTLADANWKPKHLDFQKTIAPSSSPISSQPPQSLPQTCLTDKNVIKPLCKEFINNNTFITTLYSLLDFLPSRLLFESAICNAQFPISTINLPLTLHTTIKKCTIPTLIKQIELITVQAQRVDDFLRTPIHVLRHQDSAQVQIDGLNRTQNGQNGGNAGFNQIYSLINASGANDALSTSFNPNYAIANMPPNGSNGNGPSTSQNRLNSITTIGVLMQQYFDQLYQSMLAVSTAGSNAGSQIGSGINGNFSPGMGGLPAPPLSSSTTTLPTTPSGISYQQPSGQMGQRNEKKPYVSKIFINYNFILSTIPFQGLFPRSRSSTTPAGCTCPLWAGEKLQHVIFEYLFPLFPANSALFQAIISNSPMYEYVTMWPDTHLTNFQSTAEVVTMSIQYFEFWISTFTPLLPPPSSSSTPRMQSVDHNDDDDSNSTTSTPFQHQIIPSLQSTFNLTPTSTPRNVVLTRFSSSQQPIQLNPAYQSVLSYLPPIYNNLAIYLFFLLHRLDLLYNNLSPVHTTCPPTALFTPVLTPLQIYLVYYLDLLYRPIIPTLSYSKSPLTLLNHGIIATPTTYPNLLSHITALKAATAPQSMSFDTITTTTTTTTTTTSIEQFPTDIDLTSISSSLPTILHILLFQPPKTTYDIQFWDVSSIQNSMYGSSHPNCFATLALDTILDTICYDLLNNL